MENNLQQFAYLLDNDNYMVENKIFIDLMWHIAKEKMTNTDKKGRKVLTTKSYVIRNAGIMFQQIFYWHFNAIKQGKATKYLYKGENTVKMDFEDWWNACRLTDKEISTANKFLTESNLIDIQKMRIKQKGTDVFKPSNCYIIKTDILEKYLSNIVDINKNMYDEKVVKVREKNIKTSTEHKKSTELRTYNVVTPVTVVTNEVNGLEGVENNLSTQFTQSTEDIEKNIEVPCSVTPVTGVTKVHPVTGVTKATSVTGVTKATSVTGVTNKSNTTSSDSSSPNSSYAERTDEETTPLSYPVLLEALKLKMTKIEYNTWIKSGIKDCSISEDVIFINTANSFVKEILESKFSDIILRAIREITSIPYRIKYSTC